jgi:hypothetical protein
VRRAARSRMSAEPRLSIGRDCRSMDRALPCGRKMLDHPRAVGTVLLELVLLVLVVVAGLSQRAVSGVAIAMTADPPPVGACLRQTAQGVEAIPCSEPHLFQVTRSWPVWLWDDGGVNGSAAAEVCRLAATNFLGSAARLQDWGPIPLHTLSVLTRGPGTGDQPWGWQACALSPQPGRGYQATNVAVSGSLSGATAMTTRPAQLRSCFDVVELGWMPAPCWEVHSGEFLAERLVPVTGGRLSTGSRNDLLASCRIAAPWLIGRSLAGQEGVLITVRDDGTGPGEAAPVTPATGSAAFRQRITVRCAIEAIAGHYLSGSVIGLGDQPLPLR